MAKDPSETYIDEALEKPDVKEELKNLKMKNEEKEDKKEPKKGFLANPKSLRRARGITVGLIIMLLPALYFLLEDNLTLEALLSWSMGGIIFVTTVGTFLNMSETRKSTFEDVVDANKDISDNEVTITEKGQKLSKDTIKAMPILDKYNDELQLSYDLQKTSKKISKLEREIALISITLNHRKQRFYSKFMRILLVPKLFNNIVIGRKTRKIARKTRKIEKMKVTPLRDKKFKRYRIERLLTTRSTGRYVKIGDRKIRSAPDKVDVKKTVLKLPLKGLGMSMASGAIPLIMGVDTETLIKFYIAYTLGQAFTTLSQHILTRFKTTHEFREAQVEKIRLQDMLLTELDKVKEQERLDKIEAERLAEENRIEEVKRLEMFEKQKEEAKRIRAEKRRNAPKKNKKKAVKK